MLIHLFIYFCIYAVKLNCLVIIFCCYHMLLKPVIEIFFENQRVMTVTYRVTPVSQM